MFNLDEVGTPVPPPASSTQAEDAGVRKCGEGE